MEPPESVGEHHRLEQDAGSEDEHMRCLAQIEFADPADQQVPDGKVEEAPQDIDPRGGQAFPGRRREGTLEGMARDPIAEMGQSIREEHAPEKVRHVVIPAHGCSLLADQG